MPIPNPKKGENRQKFIGRCMGNSVMLKEFPDQKQRAAVCVKQWDKSEEEVWKKIKALQNWKGLDKYRKKAIPKKLGITVINVRKESEKIEGSMEKLIRRKACGRPMFEAFNSLQQALRDAIADAGFGDQAWVADFSTKQVVYEVRNENGKYAYYMVDYSISRGVVTLGTTPKVVTRKTTYEAMEVDEKMSMSEFAELSIIDADLKRLTEGENE